jgi:hypothetical protein
MISPPRLLITKNPNKVIANGLPIAEGKAEVIVHPLITGN